MKKYQSDFMRRSEQEKIGRNYKFENLDLFGK